MSDLNKEYCDEHQFLRFNAHHSNIACPYCKIDKLEAQLAKLETAMASSCDDMRNELMGGCDRALSAEEQLEKVRECVDAGNETYNHPSAHAVIYAIKDILEKDDG